MELVYLWVEKYKNIEKQGFSFSGQYRCEYDDVKNELTISENKEYLYIFPPNINVTAIVGKNGSGKTAVLEAINFMSQHNIKEDMLVVKSKNCFYISLPREDLERLTGKKKISFY